MLCNLCNLSIAQLGTHNHTVFLRMRRRIHITHSNTSDLASMRLEPLRTP